MVVSTEPAVSATAPRPVRVPWLIWGLSAIVVLGAFTSMLSSTIATVALPGIARDLHVSFAAAQWATTDYLLALAAGVPLSGWQRDGSVPAGCGCSASACSAPSRSSAPPRAPSRS